MSQLAALLLTLTVEVGVVSALVGPREWRRAPRWRLLGTVAAASLVTHPLAWAANTLWLRDALSFVPRAAVIETGVILAEAVILLLVVPMRPRNALATSLVMNVASFTVGLLWFWLAR